MLDHNVDAHVRRPLVAAGHACWTVGEAGLSTAKDDELTVYTNNRGAVVVTHDVEFSERRSRNVVGHHLQLRCSEEDAEQLVADHLDELILAFSICPDMFVRLSVTGEVSMLRGWR